MLLSLRAKLFLTLLCVSLLAVLVSQGFMRWTFERGLADLAAERQAQRLETISERLLEVYRGDGGWDRLAADRRLWIRTLDGAPPRLDRDRRRHARPEPERSGGADGPGGPPPADHQGPPRWLRDALRDRRSEPGTWPPRHVLAGLEAGEPPRALELRLMLLDEDGAILYGREALLAGAERRPLLDGEVQIGALALLPGPPIKELADLRFQARYSVSLWLIGLQASRLLTALLAFPLSRRFTQPLADFQRTMRRLGGGDYGARVDATGGDDWAAWAAT